MSRSENCQNEPNRKSATISTQRQNTLAPAAGRSRQTSATCSLAGSREKALAAGCDEFDTKPVEFERLLDKVRTLLDRQS
jgi:CheY-like chemotaxis protein